MIRIYVCLDLIRLHENFNNNPTSEENRTPCCRLVERRKNGSAELFVRMRKIFFVFQLIGGSHLKVYGL